jgi:eukaryotic-like serine/threonine-protein kinase
MLLALETSEPTRKAPVKKIGRYDIIEELGRGAMGVVYKASDPTIGRVVAVKILSLNPSLEVGHSRGLELFLREARAAGRLSHPGVVTIYDAVEDPETHSSYIVMEFVRGQTLEKALASGQRFDTKRALEIAYQIAEALHYAHDQNVVHQDLKPANILLTDDDRVKVMDFGIAKFKGRVGSVVTDAILGTPSHMSPEQVTGGEVDARSDMFALGIILYTMLTGEQPFKGDVATVLFKIAYEDAALPSHSNPELGPAHDYLVSRCLAKDANKRYTSAREFLDDLEDVRQSKRPRSESWFSISGLHDLGATLVAKVPPIAALLTRKARDEAKRKAVVVVVGLVFFIVLAAWAVRRHYHRTSSNVSSLQAHANGASAQGPAATAGTSQLSAEPKASSGQSRPAGPTTPPGHENTSATATPPALAVKTTSAASPLAPTAKSATVPAGPTKIPAGRVVHLVCRHELQQGLLTISSGTKLILSARLRGKKKAALLGIKGGYAGVLSRPLSIPADAQELSVRIVSADGSVDLTNTISATSGAGPSATLYIGIDGPNLALDWRIMHPRAPAPSSRK